MNSPDMPRSPYEDGYAACDQFWPARPGSFVQRMAALKTEWSGSQILDVGCGEGTNASYLTTLGAIVDAVELSETAVIHARRLWPNQHQIRWFVGDARSCGQLQDAYDAVIAYGVLHCCSSAGELMSLTQWIQARTKPAGLNCICTFNDRSQDLSAHPGFAPCLVSHSMIVDSYKGWELICATDEDLHETHPHNGIPHHHSLTRLLARKPW